MTFSTKVAAVTAALALSATPAVAIAAQPPKVPGAAKRAATPAGSQNTTAAKPSPPGPGASLPAKAKAFGKRCQGESKKHVAGQKGTPFSQCVTAMAKLATGATKSPRTACKDLSKKHVAGEKGTPFSRCVVAGAKLRREQRQG
jgi:hypothetical protein